jgi:hypothetical protein
LDVGREGPCPVFLEEEFGVSASEGADHGFGRIITLHVHTSRFNRI